MTPLLGDGSGNFQPGPVAAVGNRALAADFDGDGLSDFAYQEGFSTSLAIKLSNGDGTFRDGSRLECCSIGSNTGDFNGDGIPDVVTLAGEGGSGDVFLGQLDGSFVSSGTPLSFASAFAFYNQTVVADFDRNGSQDMAVLGIGTGTVYILLNKNSFQSTRQRLVRVARTRRGRTASHLVRCGRQQAGHADWQRRIQAGWNRPNHPGAQRRRSSNHIVAHPQPWDSTATPPSTPATEPTAAACRSGFSSPSAQLRRRRQSRRATQPPNSGRASPSRPPLLRNSAANLPEP